MYSLPRCFVLFDKRRDYDNVDRTCSIDSEQSAVDGNLFAGSMRVRGPTTGDSFTLDLSPSCACLHIGQRILSTRFKSANVALFLLLSCFFYPGGLQAHLVTLLLYPGLGQAQTVLIQPEAEFCT